MLLKGTTCTVQNNKNINNLFLQKLFDFLTPFYIINRVIYFKILNVLIINTSMIIYIIYYQNLSYIYMCVCVFKCVLIQRYIYVLITRHFKGTNELIYHNMYSIYTVFNESKKKQSIQWRLHPILNSACFSLQCGEKKRNLSDKTNISGNNIALF